MSVINGHTSFVGPLVPFGDTAAASDDVLSPREIVDHTSTWRRVCDTLLGWWENPERLDDDEIEPPTRQVLERAMTAVADLQAKNDLPPLRVGPSVDGGVAFEWEKGDHLSRVVLLNSGGVEIDHFRAGRLAHSMQVPAEH